MIDNRRLDDLLDAWADCKPQVDRRMIREGLYHAVVDPFLERVSPVR